MRHSVTDNRHISSSEANSSLPSRAPSRSSSHVPSVGRSEGTATTFNENSNLYEKKHEWDDDERTLGWQQQQELQWTEQQEETSQYVRIYSLPSTHLESLLEIKKVEEQVKHCRQVFTSMLETLKDKSVSDKMKTEYRYSLWEDELEKFKIWEREMFALVSKARACWEVNGETARIENFSKDLNALILVLTEGEPFQARLSSIPGLNRTEGTQTIAALSGVEVVASGQVLPKADKTQSEASTPDEGDVEDLLDCVRNLIGLLFWANKQQEREFSIERLYQRPQASDAGTEATPKDDNAKLIGLGYSKKNSSFFSQGTVSTR